MVACLGGSFFVTSGGGPGSGAAAVTGATYGYGVYDDSPTTWANADGYLPALVTTFHRDGASICITNFGDKVSIGGHPYVVIYSRVSVTNPTGPPISVDPQPTANLIPLNRPATPCPHTGPSTTTTRRRRQVRRQLRHCRQRRPGGRGRLQPALRAHAGVLEPAAGRLAQIQLPDPRLVDAYRTGFIYTQIIRSGNELKTGVNGYDKEYSHDVIGILANMLTQGYTTGAHGLLDRPATSSAPRPSTTTGSGRTPGPGRSTCRRPATWLRQGQLRHSRTGGDRAEHQGDRSRDRGRPHRARRDHGEDQRHRRQRLLDDRQLLGADGPGGVQVAGQKVGDPAQANWAAASTTACSPR